MKIKRVVVRMLDSARSLAVTHLEHEVGLAPRTFAAKKSQFPTVDRILNQYNVERAFWITGIVKESILKEARNYILNYAKEHPEQLVPDAGFEEGLYETLKEWLPVKDAAGRMVNIASRSEVIARTNIMDMYNYARLAQMQAPELKNWVKAYRYSAILDAVTTPICRQRHGKIFTPETLNGWAPPAHFNALAEGTLIRTRNGMVPIEDVLTGNEVWTHRKRWRRVYAQMAKPADGNRVRVLFLASGRRIRITDEHPVLVAFPGARWERAGDLNVGDILFEYSEDVSRITNFTMGNPEDCPSLFDEPMGAWTILRTSATAPMVFPVDLQDDTRCRESKVGDIPPDRVLENEACPAGGEIAAHDCFMQFGIAPESIGQANCRLFRDTLHSHGVSLRHSNGMSGMDGACLLAEPPSPMGLAAGAIHSRSAIGDGSLLKARADCDPVPFAPTAQGGLSDSDIAFDGSERFALAPMPFVDDDADNARIGQVGSHDLPPGWATSAIVSIVDEEYKGNVWNLAVEEDETYLAEDVIVHNCRSVLLPVTLLDRGWQDEMAKQGPVTIPSQAGFATPGSAADIAATGRL